MATGTSELDFRVQVIVPVYWILGVSLSLVCVTYLTCCVTGIYVSPDPFILRLHLIVVDVPRCRRPKIELTLFGSVD
jgi:hypothetical protein